VILSTHIVEDVTDLCPRMAMLAQGRVLVQGRPQEAVAALQHQVWRRSVAQDDLADYQRRFAVLSTRLVGAKPQINVFAVSQPERGFEVRRP